MKYEVELIGSWVRNEGLYDGCIQIPLYANKEQAQKIADVIGETLKYIYGTDEEVWLGKNADGTTKLGQLLEVARNGGSHE